MAAAAMTLKAQRVHGKQAHMMAFLLPMVRHAYRVHEHTASVLLKSLLSALGDLVAG